MVFNRETRPTGLDLRLSKAINDILALDPSEWIEATKPLHKEISERRRGISNLKAIQVVAVDKKIAEAERIATILRREPCLEPGSNDKVFMAFKTRRIARLFKEKPEMLEYLKTQAQSASYNKGWKNKAKLYDEIAADPHKILAGAEVLCKLDEACSGLVERSRCTIRETLDAMDWYADNKYTEICGIYEEYKDVPAKDLFEVDAGRTRG